MSTTPHTQQTKNYSGSANIRKLSMFKVAPPMTAVSGQLVCDEGFAKACEKYAEAGPLDLPAGG